MPPRLAIMLAIALIASAGHAHAATAIGDVLSIPPTTDIWRHMLEIVFPGVGPLAGNPTQGTSALAAASGSFVAVLMALGAAVLCWHTVSGLVATAHEGTVLGRQWHQVWAPVRVVMGVGMLAPVVKGFCLAQILVLTLACWSGSFGNVIWSSYLDGLTSTSLSALSLPATGAVVRAFADAEMCHAALNQSRADAGLSRLPDVKSAQSNLSSGGGLAVTAGNAWNGLSSWISGGSEASTAQSNRTLVTWDYGACGSISVPLALNPDGDALVTGFDRARLTAFESLRGAMKNAASTFVGSMTSGPAGAAAAATASATLVSAVTTAKQSFDTALTAAASSLVGHDNNGALSSFQCEGRRLGQRGRVLLDGVPATDARAAGR